MNAVELVLQASRLGNRRVPTQSEANLFLAFRYRRARAGCPRDRRQAILSEVGRRRYFLLVVVVAQVTAVVADVSTVVMNVAAISVQIAIILA